MVWTFIIWSGGQFVYHVVKRFLTPFRSAITVLAKRSHSSLQLSKVLKIKKFLFHFKTTCISNIDVSVEVDTRPIRCNVTFRFLAHLSRRLTRWAYRIGLEPASVCPCVCPKTISNMNISKTRGPIATKFYLKHHWGGGKPALGFVPGRIRTLVSMATDSSHRVIVGKTASPPFLGCFWSDPFHTCR